MKRGRWAGCGEVLKTCGGTAFLGGVLDMRSVGVYSWFNFVGFKETKNPDTNVVCIQILMSQYHIKIYNMYKHIYVYIYKFI